MMSDRITHYGSVDMNMSRVAYQRLKWMQKVQKRKNIQGKAQFDSMVLLSGSSEDESIYSLPTPMRSHKQVVEAIIFLTQGPRYLQLSTL